MYRLLITCIWIISLFSLCPAPQTDNNGARITYGDVYIPPQVPLGRLAHETDVGNDHVSESRLPGHETGKPSVVDRAEDNFRNLFPNTWTEHITLPENNQPPTSEHNDESSQVRSQRQSLIVEKAEDNFRKLYPGEWKKPIELPQNDVQLPPHKTNVPPMPVTSPQRQHRDNPDDRNKNQTHLQSQPAPAPPPTPSPSSWESKFERWKAKAKGFAGFIFDVCASSKKNDINRRRRRFHSSNSSNDVTGAIFAHEAATDGEPIQTTAVAVALNDQAMNVPQVSVDTSCSFDISGCIGEVIKSIWDGISGLCCCLCDDASCLNDLGSLCNTET